MQLLILLLERGGELVSREEIAEHLWGKNVFLDVDHSINTAVRKIRVALNDDPDKPRYVETVFGKGYRFASEVTRVESTSASGQKLAAPPPTPVALDTTRARHSIWLIPIGLLVLTLGAFTAWHFKAPSTTSAAQLRIQSIAVLPLQNISGDASQDYLADGMSEELTGRLASIHGLRVTSRTSAMKFKDSKMSAPDIAKALRVDALVEGSLIRDGNRVRVHAQLIRAATDEHIWAESYDREIQDALALEAELAQAIADKIKVTTTGDEQARLAEVRKVAPEVYENYLRGRYSGVDSRAQLEQRITYFEKAIALDPTFAPAYAGLADAYDWLGTIIFGGSPEKTRPKVIAYAEKALQFDPNLVEAHLLLGDIYQQTWRWTAARAEYEKSIDLSPNDASAHLAMAYWLLCRGKTDEALSESERARQLDPFGVSGKTNGWILFHARRYDEAARELRSVPPEHPDYASAQFDLGFVLIAQGNFREAVDVLERTVALTRGAPGVTAMLIHAYARAGRRDDALRLLNEMKEKRRTSYVPAGAFVNAYAGFEDREQTFYWLERAYEEHSNILQFIETHPHFDFIRDDPRFKDLERRVGLR